MSNINDDELTRLLDEAASSYGVPEHGTDEVLAAAADQPARITVARRHWVQLSAAAVIVVAAVVFAASQLGSPVSSRTTVADQSAPLKRAPHGAVAGTTDSARRSATNGVGSTTSFGAESGSAGGGAAFAAPQSAAVAAPVPPAAAQLSGGFAAAPRVDSQVTDEGASRIVKTGSIALVVKNNQVSATLTAVQRAAKLQGGYISASSSDEYGETPSGQVTIRVPVVHFEDLVAQIRGLKAKVRTASTTGKDVTAQYSDLESQLRTLKATRERFLLILAKTKTIGEILTVQQRVDDVSGQIDRIEGSRKVLASQSDLSTLTVSVSEADDPVVKVTDKPRSGLSQAFHDAWDGFVTGVEAIIRDSGRALLVLLCIGLVLLVGRGGWRVARRWMV
ncbi:MAG: hypothetical protein JWP11_363 [Frankiales bacterium]|nr:hypothetical protein [Frankiales bacterium]